MCSGGSSRQAFGGRSGAGKSTFGWATATAATAPADSERDDAEEPDELEEAEEAEEVEEVAEAEEEPKEEADGAAAGTADITGAAIAAARGSPMPVPGAPGAAPPDGVAGPSGALTCRLKLGQAMCRPP